MDGPVPRDPDRAAIEAAARDAGIGPTDPAWGFVQFMLRTVDRLIGEYDRLHAAVSDLRAAPPVSDVQLQQITGRAAQQMDDRLLHRWTQLNRYAIGIAAAVALATAATGGLFGALWQSSRSAAEIARLQTTVIEARGDLPALSAEDRAIWLDIVRQNPNSREAMRRCQPVQSKIGGSACWLPIWTLLPPAPSETPATH